VALTEEQLAALGLAVPPPDVAMPPPSSPPAAILPSSAPPQYPSSIMGDKIPAGARIPTSNAEGKQEFQQYMPKITAQPGTTDYFRERQEQLDYKAQHPWGDPISAHPGVLGKIGHVAGAIGNIAGDILAPGPTSRIPGSQLNMQAEGKQNEQGIVKGEQEQSEQEKANAATTAANAEQTKAEATKEVADEGKSPKPEPIFDKNGAIIGFKTVSGLLSMNDPNVTPDMKAMAQAAQPKQVAAHVTYDQGVPVSVTSADNKTFDINDPKLPPELKPLVDSANRAHGQHVQEDATKQANAFAQQDKLFSDRQAATDKKTTDKKTDAVQDVLDEIAESKEYAQTPSATNDYGLLMNFIGVTKPESLAKLRLNQNEVALATGTRGTLGDIDALVEKVKNGQMLTPGQRQDMLKTMGIVENYATRRLQRIGGGNAGENSKPATKEDPLGIR
jgi:hypothetical protein